MKSVTWLSLVAFFVVVLVVSTMSTVSVDELRDRLGPMADCLAEKRCEIVPVTAPAIEQPTACPLGSTLTPFSVYQRQPVEADRTILVCVPD